MQPLTAPKPRGLIAIPAPRDPLEQVLAATLQGIWNRNPPDRQMLYLNYDQHSDFWLDWYVQRITIDYDTLKHMLGRAVSLGLVKKYICFDPARKWTINLACTRAGINPGTIVIPFARETEMRRQGISPLGSMNLPDRETGYRDALRDYLPHCRKGAFVWNHELNFHPGLYELATGYGLFCCDLNPNPDQSDQPLHAQMLSTLGPGTLMYGWGVPGNADVWGEGQAMEALSRNLGSHSGVGQVAPDEVKIGNVMVHAAMSAYYPSTYERKKKIPIAVVMSDADQHLSVVAGRMTGKNRQPLWDSRGLIPLTWGLNPTGLQTGGGIYAYIMETLHPADDLMAMAPGPYCLPALYGSNEAAFLREFNERLIATGIKNVQFIDHADPEMAATRLKLIPAMNVGVDGYGPNRFSAIWSGDRVYRGVDYTLNFNGQGQFGNPVAFARFIHGGGKIGKKYVPGLTPQAGKVFPLMFAVIWDTSPEDIKAMFDELERLAPGIYHPVTVRDLYLLMGEAHRRGEI